MQQDDRVIRTMRHMAWERAKGELKAMMCAYWEDGEQFSELNKLAKEFIKKVEDEGLHE